MTAFNKGNDYEVLCGDCDCAIFCDDCGRPLCLWIDDVSCCRLGRYSKGNSLVCESCADRECGKYKFWMYFACALTPKNT